MDTNLNGVSLDDLAGALDEPTQNDLPETDDEELAAAIPDEEEGEAEQSEADESTDDFVEAEYEGKTYKVPPELKEALLRQKDYTQKTQEVAEMRRSVEQQAQLVQQQQAVFSANLEKVAEIKGIQDKLNQFEQVDWTTLSDADPVQAQKLLIARQQLERQLAVKSQEYQQSTQQYQQLMAHQRQQQLQEAAKELHRMMPEFSAELAEKIRTSTRAYGYSDEELANVTDARLVKVLHDAMRWQELQKQRPNAMKKVADAPKAIKPQSSAPKPRTQAALQRLKQSGRVEDLASFL